MSSVSDFVATSPANGPESSLATDSAEHSNLKRIPICYVIASIDTPRAGTERHLLQLIGSLDREIFDPLLVVLRDPRWTRELQDSDLPLRLLGMGSLWNPASWYGIVRLARIMRRHRTEIAELYFVEGHFLGSIAAWLARVPQIFSWRRDLAYQYGAKEKWMLRLTKRLTTRTIANSCAVRDAIVKIEGIEPSNFSVIYNGIDLVKFDQQSTQLTSEEFNEFSRDKLVVTMVANLRPIKNIRCFLEAASRIAKAHKDVVFLILGSGEDEMSLKHYAEQLKVDDKICWGGSVSATAPYLRRSTVGCLSSDSEGLPNAIVEHMAAGLPVVATNVGGIPELVVDGVTGVLVDRGDSSGFAQQVLELLDNSERRAAMGTAGRQRIEQEFSLEGQMKVYQQLCMQGQQKVSPKDGLDEFQVELGESS